jgi:hypothetical protein
MTMRVAFIQKEPVPDPAVMSVASILTFGGHRAEAFLPRAEARIDDRLRTFAPRLLVFHVWSGMEEWATAWSRRLRAATGGAPVVWIGQHGLDHPEAAGIQGVDIVVPKDPEVVVPDLLRRLSREKELSGTAGAVWSAIGGIQHGPALEPAVDPGTLPIGDMEVYRHAPFVRDQRTLPFATGRGNLENCHAQWRPPVAEIRRRFQPAARLAADEALHRLRLHVQRRPCVRRVAFRDDTFLQNPTEHALPFLGRYGAEVGRPFSIVARPADLDEDTVRVLRAAGCDAVHLDVISGAAALRASVGQGVPDAKIQAAVELLRANGIAVQTLTVVGLPGETPDTLAATEALLAAIRPDRACVALAEGAEALGTALWARARLLAIGADTPNLRRPVDALGRLLPASFAEAAFQFHHDWTFLRSGELRPWEVGRVALALRR